MIPLSTVVQLGDEWKANQGEAMTTDGSASKADRGRLRRSSLQSVLAKDTTRFMRWTGRVRIVANSTRPRYRSLEPRTQMTSRQVLLHVLQILWTKYRA